MLLPQIDDPDTAPFWAAARQHRLVVQLCRECHQLRFPPGPFCPSCRCTDFDWPEVSGRARVWSFVVPHAPTLPPFSDFTPFIVAVVTLAEGAHLRMVGNILNSSDAELNSVAASSLEIGDEVTVGFRDISEDVSIPVWLPSQRKGL